MKVSVLISNYNYQQYLLNAIESVLKQSVKVDEIIIVDDCSIDNSQQLLQDNFLDYNNIKLVLKDKNQGQLSCFNVGFEVSTGDIIFFLDADDIYEENYIEEGLKFYEQNEKCDFLFCAFERFGDETQFVFYYERDRDLGCSAISTLHRRRWLGSPTSTLSMSRATLEKILPIPYLEDWRTRADDCLVFGASLVGARKFYLSQSLVKYRVHGKNNFYSIKKERNLEHLKRLFQFLSQKNQNECNLWEQIYHEFKTIPEPRYKEFRLYLSLIKHSGTSWFRKLTVASMLVIHFLRKGDFMGKVPNWHVSL
uniref:glycosyltransferase family 2 protein n=1 Tax=Trichocoleus desertorum TaxID=1481672 RepID=UPI0025B3D432|nr:glycosyltransferase family 2 protein [Trichocoleus desertorum]